MRLPLPLPSLLLKLPIARHLLSRQRCSGGIEVRGRGVTHLENIVSHVLIGGPLYPGLYWKRERERERERQSAPPILKDTGAGWERSRSLQSEFARRVLELGLNTLTKLFPGGWFFFCPGHFCGQTAVLLWYPFSVYSHWSLYLRCTFKQG